MSEALPTQGSAPGEPTALRGVLSAALLISLGNIRSRVVGFVREPIVAYYFGRGLEVDAFLSFIEQSERGVAL